MEDANTVIDQERFAEIAELLPGKHDSIEQGMCAMEAASYITREPWSDHPACVSPVIASFMRVLNDAMPDESRTDVLLPLIPKVIGTVGDKCIERIRGLLVVEWFLGTYMATWFETLRMPIQAASAREAHVSADGTLGTQLKVLGTFMEFRSAGLDEENPDPHLVVRLFLQQTMLSIAAISAGPILPAGEALELDKLRHRAHDILVIAIWSRIKRRGSKNKDVIWRYLDVLDATVSIVESRLQVGAVELIERLIAVPLRQDVYSRFKLPDEEAMACRTATQPSVVGMVDG